MTNPHLVGMARCLPCNVYWQPQNCIKRPKNGQKRCPKCGGRVRMQPLHKKFSAYWRNQRSGREY